MPDAPRATIDPNTQPCHRSSRSAASSSSSRRPPRPRRWASATTTASCRGAVGRRCRPVLTRAPRAGRRNRPQRRRSPSRCWSP
eukprot:scaffold59978_cov61-Phaeocystis_antarctica.AAC.5